MDGTQALSPRPVAEPSIAAEVCPCCGEAWSDVPPIESGLFRNRPLRRCLRCGVRFTADVPPYLALSTCSACGLPFLGEQREPRCGDCTAGRRPGDLPDPAVAAAAEAEVRQSLERELVCVGSPTLLAYLDRVARQVARTMPGAPPACRVAIVEHESLETLALPSGILLISLGVLAGLEDEAELVFVLGHELAHVASGDAASTLVRLGLRSMAREHDAPSTEIWTQAAMDLVKLGHGKERELRADAAALQGCLSLGYDAVAAQRFLRRVDRRIEQGDPQVQEYASAHPPPRDRIRKIDSVLFGHVDTSTARTNREVFRRAAGHDVLSGGLVRMEGFGTPTEDEEPELSRRDLVLIGSMVGVLLLLTLALLLTWLF